MIFVLKYTDSIQFHAVFLFFEGQTGWTEIEKWLNNWETQAKRDNFFSYLGTGCCQKYNKDELQ